MRKIKPPNFTPAELKELRRLLSVMKDITQHPSIRSLAKINFDAIYGGKMIRWI